MAAGLYSSRYPCPLVMSLGLATPMPVRFAVMQEHLQLVMYGALHLHASTCLLLQGGGLHVPCQLDASTCAHSMLTQQHGLHVWPFFTGRVPGPGLGPSGSDPSHVSKLYSITVGREWIVDKDVSCTMPTCRFQSL